MALARAGAVGAEEPVPDRKVETEIRVVFVPVDGMVHPVHVGRHDERTDPLVRAADVDVRMVEHCSGVEHHLEQDDGGGRRAEQRDGAHLDPHAEQDFDGMEANARRRIDIPVRVMHAVQPPEQPGLVKHHMLDIDEKIERNERQHEGDGFGRGCPVEKTEPVLLRQHRDADREQGNGDAKQQRPRTRQRQVGRPSLEPRAAAAAPRDREFQQQHQGKHAGKGGKPQGGFVQGEEVEHSLARFGLPRSSAEPEGPPGDLERETDYRGSGPARKRPPASLLR